jgi:hypothetical protein
MFYGFGVKMAKSTMPPWHKQRQKKQTKARWFLLMTKWVLEMVFDDGCVASVNMVYVVCDQNCVP